MNKKFSTLVAALLVSGVSYAVVSQIDGTAVANGVQTTAVASSTATTSEATEAKAAISLGLGDIQWTFVNGHLQWGNFYLTTQAGLSKNIAEAATVTCENSVLKVNGQDLTVNGVALSAFDAATKVVAATLTANGTYYIAKLQYETPAFAATNVAIKTLVPTLEANLSGAGGTEAAGSGAAVFASLKKFTIKQITDGTYVLTLGDYFVKANGSGDDIELTAIEAEASVFTIDGSGYVKIGGGSNQFLSVSGGSSSLANTNANAVKAWKGSDGAAVATVDIAADLEIYLSTVNTTSQTNVAITADEQNPTVAKVTIAAAGALDAAANLTAVAKSGNGLDGFTLNIGSDFLVAGDGDAVSVGATGDALIFSADASNNLMLGAKYLVIDGSALKLVSSVTGAAKNVKAYNTSGVSVSLSAGNFIIGEAIPTKAKTLDLATDNTLLAKITSSANLINGENYFITATDGALCALAMNATGFYDHDAPTAGESVSLRASAADDVTEALWTVEKTQLTGQEATYKFKNRATGKYLGLDIVDNAVALKVNGKYNVFKLDGEGLRVTVLETGANTSLNGNYFVHHKSSGSSWDVSNTNYAITFKAPKEIPANKPAIDEQIKYLNQTAGNGAGFGVMFKETGKDGKLKNMTVSANPFTDAALITAVKGPGEFADLYTVGTTPVTTADLSGKMFFRVEGDYSSAMKQGSADEKKAKIAAFRSSKFIVVDTVRYSKHISDVDGANNYFVKYKTVAGSELLSTVGKVFDASYAYDEDNFSAYHATKNTAGGTMVGVTRRIENAAFTVDQLAGSNIADPAYIYATAAIPAANNGIGLEGHTAANATPVKLYIAVKEYDKVNYVGAAEEAQRWNQVYLGLNNDVDYTSVNGIVNIISRNYKTDGQVYANLENTADGSIGRVLAKYVSLDKPEGQFLVTGGDYAANGSINPFVFTNRESGKANFVNGSAFSLKKTDKANIYWMVGTTDTVEIKSASTANQYVGYKNYTQNELKNTTYVLKVSSKAGGVNDLYITEDHNKDHSLGLHADTLESANFKLVKFEAAKSDKKQYGDTVYVSQVEAPYSYLKGDDKEYAADKNDRVVAFTYAIYNADNKEFLTVKDMGTTLENYYYCNPDLKYTGDDMEKNAAVAQRFIVKEKADGTYQLIPVKHIDSDGKNIFEVATEEEAPVLFTATATSKLYVGLSDNKVHYESPIYKIADNDLFRIVPVGAPMYRTVETAPFDTVRIYKEGMDNVALFAETADKKIVSGGHFLGMKHKADKDLTKTMFSFFVDTAYVNRTDNYKPQYMLVLDADTIHGEYTCNIPEHPIHDSGRIDTVTGKFLTTMVDSIPSWGNKHNNPYWWEKSEYPRLGFVNAKHIGDDLIVLRDNGIQTKADTIKLDNNSDKSGVFAFRYVDQASKSFLMETKGGWVKWLNGVPVVVSKIEEAEVFNFEATSNKPTSNEGVTASEVSVIAGNGSIIVKGAAGKTVAISNILGQTIASTVLTSDNATIAVPAGIVVVAVEGEEAAKVVVR